MSHDDLVKLLSSCFTPAPDSFPIAGWRLIKIEKEESPPSTKYPFKIIFTWQTNSEPTHPDYLLLNLRDCTDPSIKFTIQSIEPPTAYERELNPRYSDSWAPWLTQRAKL